MFDKKLLSIGFFLLAIMVSVVAVPSAITGLTAENEGTTGNPIIHITWTATDLNQTCFDGYKIDKSIDSSAFTQIKSEDTNSVVAYDDTSIAPGQYLKYRISTVAADNSDSNVTEDCGLAGVGTSALSSEVSVDLAGGTTSITDEFINLFWVALNIIRKFIGLFIVIGIMLIGFAALFKIIKDIPKMGGAT